MNLVEELNLPPGRAREVDALLMEAYQTLKQAEQRLLPDRGSRAAWPEFHDAVGLLAKVGNAFSKAVVEAEISRFKEVQP